jgi:hypothetical protein
MDFSAGGHPNGENPTERDELNTKRQDPGTALPCRCGNDSAGVNYRRRRRRWRIFTGSALNVDAMIAAKVTEDAMRPRVSMNGIGMDFLTFCH